MAEAKEKYFGILSRNKKHNDWSTFSYLVIFGKPGFVLAKVSTVQCTCWWVRSTQIVSKIWLNAQAPGPSSAMRQILNWEDDSCRFICSVHIRVGSWMKMVSLRRKGEVDYVTWQGEAEWITHVKNHFMQLTWSLRTSKYDYTRCITLWRRKNTTSEQAVATLKWEGDRPVFYWMLSHNTSSCLSNKQHTR